MPRQKGPTPPKVVLSVRVAPEVVTEAEAVRALVQEASPVPVRQADVLALALSLGLSALRREYGEGGTELRAAAKAELARRRKS